MSEKKNQEERKSSKMKKGDLSTSLFDFVSVVWQTPTMQNFLLLCTHTTIPQPSQSSNKDVATKPLFPALETNLKPQ